MSKQENTAQDALPNYDVPEAEGKTRFLDLDLDPRLLRGIADLGFEYCSPIQAQVLPYCLDGLDAIGKAQTGTGKTAAFLITIFNDLLNNPIEGERFVGEPRALVIAPTRELVMQIAADAKDLGKHTGLKIATLIGGMDYQKQLNRLQNEIVDLVVATPGRLIDFMGRRDIVLNLVEILVLDEADRMLDMGFIPQVKRIVKAGRPCCSPPPSPRTSSTCHSSGPTSLSKWKSSPSTWPPTLWTSACTCAPATNASG